MNVMNVTNVVNVMNERANDVCCQKSVCPI